MKTVLFSVIQFDRTLIWTHDNIFAVSGTVSNYLITGFNTGYCPNLFIPQNNMFRLKGTGHTKTLLFDRLIYNLYNKEILLSSAVENILMKSKTDLEIHSFPKKFQTVEGLTATILNHSECIAVTSQIELMLRGNLNTYNAAVIQNLASYVFRSTAVMIQW